MRARVLELARGAQAAIEAARARIDDLNVYPVPDGDTGTNLALTVRAVVDALEADGPDERAALAHEVSRAALMGARGNSGVILSQIVRGAADSLARATTWPRRFARRATPPTAPSSRPVEGTMLTAIRELAEEAEARRRPRGARRARRRLRRADARDAPRARGGRRRRRGRRRARRDPARRRRRALGRAAASRRRRRSWRRRAWSPSTSALSRFRYCTAFVVEGDAARRRRARDGARAARRLDPRRRRPDARSRCTSTPTTRAGRCRSASRAARSRRVEIANMHAQTLEREQRLLRVVPEAEDERRARSSPWPPGPATGRSSRASAHTSSTAGAR